MSTAKSHTRVELLGRTLALRVLRDELEIAMALKGVNTLDEATREMLFDRPWPHLGVPWELPRSAPGDA